MNKKLPNLAIIFTLLAAFVGLEPIWAETGVSQNLNNRELSDNLGNTERLIAHLESIKDSALENYRQVAPPEVEQAVNNCLVIVKQLASKSEKALDALSTAAAIMASASEPKLPLVSPLQNWQKLP